MKSTDVGNRASLLHNAEYHALKLGVSKGNQILMTCSHSAVLISVSNCVLEKDKAQGTICLLE